MKKKLFILSNSVNSDIYINIIVLNVEKFDIKEVELIHIYDEQEMNINTINLSSKILKQLEYILQGKYNLYNNNTGNYTEINLESYDENASNSYKKTHNIFIKHINERNVALKDFFNIIKDVKKSDEGFLFDVTTLKKDILTNLIPVFIENNIMEDIYYFERYTPWKHNQLDLIHNLQHSEIKYDKILKDKTITYLTDIKRTGKKRILFINTMFIIIISSFILILLGLSSEILGIIGTMASLISLIPSVYDVFIKKK